MSSRASHIEPSADCAVMTDHGGIGLRDGHGHTFLVADPAEGVNAFAHGGLVSFLLAVGAGKLGAGAGARAFGLGISRSLGRRELAVIAGSIFSFSAMPERGQNQARQPAKPA